MASRLIRPNKPSTARIVFRRLYYLLVILSALIVALFCLYLYMTRLPEITPPSVSDGGTLPTITKVDAPQGGVSGSDDTAPVPTRRDGCYTFLLCGTDNDNGGTDTMIAVLYDTAEQKVNMVSIPRDTMIYNSSGSLRKLNSVYNNGGMDALRERVSALLGIPIDFTVRVSLKGFAQAVEAIGGVWFDVPVNMNYDDPTVGQELHIHINKGYQLLNGEDALKVMRYRHDNDSSVNASYTDSGRMQTQQAFIKTVVAQTLQLSNVSKIPELVQVVTSNVETDLTLSNITAFANQVFLNLDPANITTQNLPGDYDVYYKKGWYVALDPQGVVDMVNECLNPYDTPITLADVDILTMQNGSLVQSKDLAQ